MESVDCLVVGAGVIGLAVARALARAGREVVILEAADAIGTHTSARNSEVVHAGIYYPAGSLKARFCVEGRERLYAFCAERGVAAPRIGKLIVATDPAQHDDLRVIQAKAARNGVNDLRWLEAAEAMALEPALSCTAALLSPSTGIVDSHGYMLALLGEAEEKGASLALLSPFEGAVADENGFVVTVGGDAGMRLRCRMLVNAAGLWAPKVAGAIEGLNPGAVPEAYFAKGNYFMLSGVKPPFARLIYPVPEPGGLGTHVTLDIAGQMRFGPDVEWVEMPAWQPDYRVNPARGEKFYAAVRRYWPGLPDGAIQPGYAGLRPKLSPPPKLALQGGSKYGDDFVIQNSAEHGRPGLINLFGIESPGLTSSLALADAVAAQLAQDLR